MPGWKGVAEFEETLRATHGRLAWAAQDKITSEGARLIKRAPRYPVFMLMLLEALVLDVGHATGWRIWAWAKLVKVWASLRWSDLQAIIPPELALVEGRLTTVLRRTKTSGPSRRIKELPVAISEDAYFLRSTWLGVGFDLPGTHANYKQDYLLPRLNQDGLLEKKPASYADAMVATAGLLSILGLPLEVQGYWTKEGDLGVPDSVSDIPAGGPPLDDPAAEAWDADSSQASATEPEEPVCKQAKVLDREARYVIVELPGAVFRLHKAALVVVGWVEKGPSATAGITPLGRRPMNTRMCVSSAVLAGQGGEPLGR